MNSSGGRNNRNSLGSRINRNSLGSRINRNSTGSRIKRERSGNRINKNSAGSRINRNSSVIRTNKSCRSSSRIISGSRNISGRRFPGKVQVAGSGQRGRKRTGKFRKQESGLQVQLRQQDQQEQFRQLDQQVCFRQKDEFRRKNEGVKFCRYPCTCVVQARRWVALCCACTR